jgi:hypothetical protein
LLILAASTWSSPMTDLPNFVLNAPLHHPTWWSPAAFRALCRTFDLEEVELKELPGQPFASPVHWICRLSPVHSGERYFCQSWRWHPSLLFGPLRGLVAEGGAARWVRGRTPK